MTMEGGAAAEEEVVTVELPAPPGWTKTFVLKSGGLPKANEVVFVAPTGEEIRSKKQLDQYLRSHPGGLRSSVFDWGAGDTPRRSARISERARARVAPEIEPPVKKGKRSASRKGGKERGGVAGDAQAPDVVMEGDTRPMEEDKEDADIGMKGSEAPGEGADATLDDAGRDAAQKVEGDTQGKNAEATRAQVEDVAGERAKEEDAQTKNAEATKVQEEGEEEKSAGAMLNNAETTKAQVESVEEKADEAAAAPVTSVLPREEFSTGKETAAENGSSGVQDGQEQVHEASQTPLQIPPPPSASSSNDGQPCFPQASSVNREGLTC